MIAGFAKTVRTAVNTTIALLPSFNNAISTSWFAVFYACVIHASEIGTTISARQQATSVKQWSTEDSGQVAISCWDTWDLPAVPAHWICWFIARITGAIGAMETSIALFASFQISVSTCGNAPPIEANRSIGAVSTINKLATVEQRPAGDIRQAACSNWNTRTGRNVGNTVQRWRYSWLESFAALAFTAAYASIALFTRVNLSVSAEEINTFPSNACLPNTAFAAGNVLATIPNPAAFDISIMASLMRNAFTAARTRMSWSEPVDTLAVVAANSTVAFFTEVQNAVVASRIVDATVIYAALMGRTSSTTNNFASVENFTTVESMRMARQERTTLDRDTVVRPRNSRLKTWFAPAELVTVNSTITLFTVIYSTVSTWREALVVLAEMTKRTMATELLLATVEDFTALGMARLARFVGSTNRLASVVHALEAIRTVATANSLATIEEITTFDTRLCASNRNARVISLTVDRNRSCRNIPRLANTVWTTAKTTITLLAIVDSSVAAWVDEWNTVRAVAG